MKPDHQNTCVLILAGGQGRRMQYTDKGLMQWQGKTLTEHVLANVTGFNQVLISANQNNERYQQFGYPVITDAIDGFKGPLSGIYSALLQLQSSRPAIKYLLVLPCDCPQPPASLFDDLAAAMNSQIDIALAHDGEREQPLFALYHVRLLDKLRNALENNEHKVMRFVHQQPHTVVDFSDQALSFKNFNHPEDMQA